MSRVQQVKDKISEDRRLTVQILASDMGTFTDTVPRILQDLNMSKVGARWAPRLLTDDQKAQHVTMSSSWAVTMRKGRCFRIGSSLRTKLVYGITIRRPKLTLPSGNHLEHRHLRRPGCAIRRQAHVCDFRLPGHTINADYYSKVILNQWNTKTKCCIVI